VAPLDCRWLDNFQRLFTIKLMTKKAILYFFIVLLALVAFLVILGFVSPKPAEAPAPPSSTFQGPPPGPPGGFTGPTGPPPGFEN